MVIRYALEKILRRGRVMEGILFVNRCWGKVGGEKKVWIGLVHGSIFVRKYFAGIFEVMEIIQKGKDE